MGGLRKAQRQVFFAPTARRSFLTCKAAAAAEARALLARKYPTDPPEPEIGYGGWHWSYDERLVKVHTRLARMIHRQALEPSNGRE